MGLLKERDSEQEEKTKENINGFKFLYMSLLKDFDKKMEGRDKVLDDNDAYRRKMWLENLDLINNNLSKFLEVMTELERNMNTLGMRQDELPKRGNQVGGETERKIWVAEVFTLSFLFFSFLFFSLFSFSVFHRFRVDYFSFSLFSFYFLDLDVIVLSRSWMQNSIIFKLLPGMFEVQTNF